MCWTIVVVDCGKRHRFHCCCWDCDVNNLVCYLLQRYWLELQPSIFGKQVVTVDVYNLYCETLSILFANDFAVWVNLTAKAMRHWWSVESKNDAKIINQSFIVSFLWMVLENDFSGWGLRSWQLDRENYIHFAMNFARLCSQTFPKDITYYWFFAFFILM